MVNASTSKKITVALVGQVNVGKSVVFNFLTGLNQHIGNWPGKTVTKAEGRLCFNNHIIDVIDLPGVYSLTTFSMEEVITREFILQQKPNLVINVVDATSLERNLILTLQLLELEVPVILAVNLVDLLPKKGVLLDYKKLSSILNVPVVPIVAIYGKGIDVLLNSGFELISSAQKPATLNYGFEVEKEIVYLSALLSDIKLPYPKRWLAIKLLEKDSQINKLTDNVEILQAMQAAITRLEKIHGHDSSVTIAAERCYKAYEIATEVTKTTRNQKKSFSEKIDNIVCNRIIGYPILIGIIAIIFGLIFTMGNKVSSYLESFSPIIKFLYYGWLGNGFLANLGWAGVESFLGIVTLVIPYIVPLSLIHI